MRPARGAFVCASTTWPVKLPNAASVKSRVAVVSGAIVTCPTAVPASQEIATS